MFRLLTVCCIGIFLTCQCSLAQHVAATHALTFASKTTMHIPDAATSSLSEVEEYLEALFAPGTVPQAGIPALTNALGDVVQDSVVNILDLLRLRDIVIGRPPSATPAELAKGDLNGDGRVDTSDIAFLRDVLLQKRGVPYLVDSTGGKVMGAGVTMIFDSAGIGGNTIMRIDRQSPQDIQQLTGVDFSSLASDSTYYMTGFKVESSSDQYVYPPQMSIKLDQMPPCNLNGDNLLMTARRGPDGTTELVLLTPMAVAADSSLLVPPPPYPAISLALLAAKASPATVVQVEPFQTFDIAMTNFSENLGANVVYFSSSGGWIAVQASDFVPVGSTSFSQITGIRVRVPFIGPGTCTIKVEHSGTGLFSNEAQIQILRLHTFQGNADSLITQSFTAIDSFVVSLPNDTSFGPSMDPNLRPSIVRFSEVVHGIVGALRDSILKLPVDARNEYAAVFENMHLLEIIDTALSHPNQQNLNRKAIEAANSGDPTEGARVVISGVLAVAHCTLAIASGGADIYDDVTCALGAAHFTLDLYFYAKHHSTHSILKLTKMDYLSSVKLTNNVFRWGWRSATRVEDDPSFQTRKYPGLCLNIWRHNTNGFGVIGGGENSCAGGCCVSSPPSGGGCPGTPPPPPYANNGRFSLISTNNTVVNPFVSPLKDAIVRPLNGALTSVVGVVDGAGAFAIPALQPGDTIHFSIYDPHSGLFDPDAGFGVSPNIYEHGVWFPVFLYFNPNQRIPFFTLNPGETAQDSISVSRQRIDYQVNITAQDTSKLFNIGFHASAELSFKLEDPQGNVFFSDTNTACYSIARLKLSQIGTYKIRVALGVNVLPGSFIVGLSYSPSLPIPLIFLCDDVFSDTLYQELSPYVVSGQNTIDSDRSITVEPGTRFQFQNNSAITAGGSMSGTSTISNPIILLPVAGSVQANGIVRRDFRSKFQVAKKGEKK